MGINPSGRGNNNDLWISGAHNQHEDVQDAGGSLGAIGAHNVSTENNTKESSSFLSRIGSIVRGFFSGLFSKSSSSKTSSRTASPQTTPSSSRRSSHASDDSSTSSMEIGGSGSDSDSARSTEGAARGLQKKGYTPGTRVQTPTVPPEGARRLQRPTHPAPQPPVAPSTSSSGVRVKRQAPQPPTGGSHAKLQRRGSTSSMSSIDSIGSESSAKESASIASRLKLELEAHSAKRQTQLASLSDQIRDRWTNNENQTPLEYKLSSLQTLAARCSQAREESRLKVESSLTRPAINEAPLKMATSQARSLWDLGEKEYRSDGGSDLLQVLTRMALEGGLLSPEVDYEDYVSQLIDEYGDPDQGYSWQPILQSLARELNSIREANPSGMPKFWSSFSGKGEAIMRSAYNRTAATNTGKYDSGKVQAERRWNNGALDLMKGLSPETYVKTASVLAVDVFSFGED
ncbi:hypothetical protein CF0942 [Chlamydia felis Fe/C-56]|uniref:Uncharacterized protein n=1 Tax=Chlamydia felis (strain Fe/C-56) TaxID=264202 RepID=Q252S4_CHLFF|nr:hypothetical protein [Chlamydia felis]BAE81714.1 hypothetical protein CF0942 [Chlamydia felis Fe/C-56]